jgi:polysaccharide pyruvyl transferase WcaK-like protein
MNRQDSSLRDVFVILTGVSGNLGDAVIRRRVLEWCRPVGRIHAYVGRTTPGWIEQLGFRDGETVYAGGERKLWLRRLLLGRGKRTFVFDPGEVPLGREHLKSEILFLLIVALVRLRGGRVIRPPRAVGDYDRLTAGFYKASARLSNVVLWRDGPSLERMGVGELSPDTAFAEPPIAGEPHGQRRNILVTMRGKRPLPSDAWFEGIASFARESDLRVIAMSQVDEDEKRTEEIAARLGAEIAEYRPWGERTDLEQEIAVRAAYESCALVVSDRLHVLILAAKAGAVPVEIAPSPAAKIRTHFATIGYDRVTSDSVTMSAGEVHDVLARQVLRSAEVDSKLSAAQKLLEGRILQFLPRR